VDARGQAASALYPAVEREQPLAVGGDVEALELPGRDPQVHHNGTDVSEKTWAYGFTLVHHLQPRGAELSRGGRQAPVAVAQVHRVLEGLIQFDVRTPVVIGTGWLTHCPLAYGYQRRERWVYRSVLSDYKQYQLEFYVNQGWGGSSNGWIPAETWYAGPVRP
jgi:hypothetical protein